jgi:hypothetical protein
VASDGDRTGRVFYERIGQRLSPLGCEQRT